MKTHFSYSAFYKLLQRELPRSSGALRKQCAITILEEDLDIKDLAKLLFYEPKVATRFLWLLSEIGFLKPGKLFQALPYLFEVMKPLNPAYQLSFASYWHLVGVPPQNEGKAVDLLFHWLLSAETNVTTKSRSIWVLHKLSKKYPELKNELCMCLEDQMGKHSADFEKRVRKILIALEK